jgi:hypothetical protein
VYRFLSEESYWAQGRPESVVDALVHGTARVVGLCAPGDGEQVGFARVVSDGMVHAPQARPRGAPQAPISPSGPPWHAAQPTRTPRPGGPARRFCVQ